MTTHKFKFDCLDNRLWWINEKQNYEIPKTQQFTTEYSNLNFILDSSQPNHWISFTTYGNKIQVFYKQIRTLGEIVYYQKDIPKKTSIEFELTKFDIVARKSKNLSETNSET